MKGTLSPCRTCLHTQNGRLSPRRKAFNTASLSCQASNQSRSNGTRHSNSNCNNSSPDFDCRHPTQGVVNCTACLPALCMPPLRYCVVRAAASLTRRQTLQALAAAAAAVAIPADAVTAAETTVTPTADVQVTMFWPSQHFTIGRSSSPTCIFCYSSRH